ncbi:MAG TPA: class I SAM-dependent methyltransferase [Burkholderiales bacterium]|nr:class I SAM-dependent methyltransferase [Burkholderiales bacterium]
MTEPAAGISASLQASYNEQYSEATSAWREIGAKYKVRNLLEVCAGHRFARVLDCGAGEGSMLKFLDAEGAFAELYAVEISDSGLAVIKSRNLPKLRDARKFDGYRIPHADKAFDLVFCSHVLEHVEHPRILLRELRRVGAYQAFEVPLDYGNALDGQTGHLLSYGHINVFTPSLFRFLLKSEGYRILAERLTHVAPEVLRFNLYRNLKRDPTLARELAIRIAPLRGALVRLLRGRRYFEEFGYAAYTCLAQGVGELKVF